MNNIGITGIITFNMFEGIKFAGSSFLRAERLAANTTDFKLWEHGTKYDNLIFQKVYWKEMMMKFKGPKILDLTDPDWIRGKINIIEIGNLVDAITCSSEKLTQLIRNYFPKKPVIFVTDRLDFSIFPSPKEKHTERAKKVVWFGFSHNALETLSIMIDIIKEHNLTLKIVANKYFENDDFLNGIKVEFVKYEQETAYEEIKDADIVINPKSERALFKYKSNNKTIIGWKLGLPVAESPSELIRFLNPQERVKEVKNRQPQLEEFEIQKSAQQYRDIIKAITS